MVPTLHIRLLGDFLLVSGETPVTTITIPRVQSLLAYLLLHRDAPQDRSRLAFLLWPDSTEAQAHTNLRKLVYQLRQSFPDVDHFLRSDKHSLQWLPSHEDISWTLDVQEMEQALAHAEQAHQAQDMTALRQALQQALHLYGGDLLPSCYDEWILPERDRLRQVFQRAAERLIALLEEERDYEAAISIAQRLLRQDSLQEAVYRQLMRLYALRGDRASALRVYHTCVTTLERELGAAPSEITQALYEALMQSDLTPKTQTGPLTPREAAPPLLGRKAEWRKLQEAWRKALDGQPHIALLSGEAGIGKTRLAEEMEAWVSRQGIATASARCYAAGGRLAYAPIATWLRTPSLQAGLSTLDHAWLTEITRLVPELLRSHSTLPRPAGMTESWQRQRFFEALAHAMLHAPQPLLLLLDDLQWCDQETLEWLHYLFRFGPETRLLLISTVRSEEILPDHPLRTSLGAWQRDGLLSEIPLGPLTSEETATLAAHVAGKPLDPVQAHCLYTETEGNPLFIVEMVRASTLAERQEGQQRTKPPALLTSAASALPATVQTVLATRLAHLSPQAQGVANVAAVIGRAFPFSVLAHASGEQEESIVRGLDELWQRRIVREQGAGLAESYDFSHDKLREQVYTALSPAYRRLLHRRVAGAFEKVYEHDLDSISVQVAAHYERAGLPERAIPYYRRAGEAAMRIYAISEATAALQRAAALLKADSPTQQARQWEMAAQIYTTLGDIFMMTGRQKEAREAYQRGRTYLPALELLTLPADNAASQHGLLDKQRIWHARLLRKTASTWNHASNNPLDTFHINAVQAFEEAERILAQATVKTSLEWVHEWIDLQLDQLLPLRGSVEEMTAIIEKAQAVIEQHGTIEQRGRLFQAVVARDAARDRYVASEEIIAYCRDALAALLPTGNKSLIGFAHFVLGNRLLWADQFDEAEEEMRTAMSLAEQTGNTTLLTRCLTFLPFVFRRLGQVEKVRSVIARALAIPDARNIAIIKGHQAWLAWRDGNLDEAEVYGRASIEEWLFQHRLNTFQWAGVWPLIGVALAREKLADAMNYVHVLLDPTQQLLPARLNKLLEASLEAWNSEQQQEAHALIQEAVPLAEQMGYL